LNQLDNYIKRELRCKYYSRYVDDFVLLSEDKEELKIWREKIKEFVKKHLKLDIHPNKIIMQKISQ
jgi:retron-type reverse transcriptase